MARLWLSAKLTPSNTCLHTNLMGAAGAAEPDADAPSAAVAAGGPLVSASASVTAVQIRICLSPPHVASAFPLGAHAAHHTTSLWPDSTHARLRGMGRGGRICDRQPSQEGVVSDCSSEQGSAARTGFSPSAHLAVLLCLPLLLSDARPLSFVCSGGLVSVSVGCASLRDCVWDRFERSGALRSPWGSTRLNRHWVVGPGARWNRLAARALRPPGGRPRCGPAEEESSNDGDCGTEEMEGGAGGRSVAGKRDASAGWERNRAT